MSRDGLSLGIDIGTSKIAAVILDPSEHLEACVSLPHHANIPAGPGCFEQDPNRLYSVACRAVRSLPDALRARVQSVGLTGQMHGVMLVDQHNQPVGSLITWQDQRALAEGFLDALRERLNSPISAGYGCVTLAWLSSKNRPPSEEACGATIHAWLASRLCGMDRPVLDPTDAYSWGMYDDVLGGGWEWDEISQAGIPQNLIPDVVPTGDRLGTLTEAAAEDFGLPVSSDVFVAVGDNQASVLATLDNPQADLSLTLGTGGQLSAIVKLDKQFIKRINQHVFAKPDQIGTDHHPGKKRNRKCAFDSYELRPFPEGKHLAVSAILCGGAAWNWLAESVQQWRSDFSVETLDTSDLYARLNGFGMKSHSRVIVRPHFLGERFDPSLRGRIDGLDLHPLDIGSLARGVAMGIVDTLRILMPSFILKNRKRIVASGNALRKNPLIVKAAEEVFNLPVILSPLTEEAACGAAKIAMGRYESK